MASGKSRLRPDREASVGWQKHEMVLRRTGWRRWNQVLSIKTGRWRLLRRAIEGRAGDDAIYRAKALSRSRVLVAGSPSSGGLAREKVRGKDFSGEICAIMLSA